MSVSVRIIKYLLECESAPRLLMEIIQSMFWMYRSAWVEAARDNILKQDTHEGQSAPDYILPQACAPGFGCHRMNGLAVLKKGKNTVMVPRKLGLVSNTKPEGVDCTVWQRKVTLASKALSVKSEFQ